MDFRDYHVALVLHTTTWPPASEPVAAVAWSGDDLHVYAPPGRSAIEAALRFHFAAAQGISVEDSLAAFSEASHPYRVCAARPVHAVSLEHAARSAFQAQLLRVA